MNFSKDSYWLKSGFFSLLQNVSNMLLGYGGFYLLVRSISVEDFGIWTLFLSTTSIVEVARVGFIKNGFIRLRSMACDAEKELLFGSSFFLNACFSFFISILFIGLAAPVANLWHSPKMEGMFYIYSITSILLIPFFQFEFLRHAQYNFRSVFVSYFVRNVILFLFIVLSFFKVLKITTIYLAATHLIGVAISSAMCLYFMRKSLTLRFSWQFVVKLINYGKYVVGTSLSSMLYSTADQFMLGSMVSATSVGIYGAASRITNLINIPSMSLSTIVFPKSAELFASGGKDMVKRLYEKSVGTLLAIVFPAVIFILIFPAMVIELIAGSSYYDAVPILQISILYSFFLPFAYQFGVVFDSIGLPKLNFYYTSITLVFNIAFNYILISKFGMMGAVYGTLLAIAIGFVIMQFLLRYKLGVRTGRVFVEMIKFYATLSTEIISRIKRF